MRGWIYGCLLALGCVSATEHVLLLGPAVAYTNWKQATDLAPTETWSSGRYQFAGHLGWYMMLTPNVFTGFHGLWAQESQVTIDELKQKLSASDVSAISGFRYQYSRYETRLWWGINYRDMSSSVPELMNSNSVWGPCWGVSYGAQAAGKPWSWHWGVMMTPGYYHYGVSPAIQIPMRTSTYLSLEWKLG